VTGQDKCICICSCRDGGGTFSPERYRLELNLGTPRPTHSFRSFLLEKTKLIGGWGKATPARAREQSSGRGPPGRACMCSRVRARIFTQLYMYMYTHVRTWECIMILGQGVRISPAQSTPYLMRCVTEEDKYICAYDAYIYICVPICYIWRLRRPLGSRGVDSPPKHLDVFKGAPLRLPVGSQSHPRISSLCMCVVSCVYEPSMCIHMHVHRCIDSSVGREDRSSAVDAILKNKTCDGGGSIHICM